ncbi:MAG TPA: SMC-Scp complex subunit ScpB [Armatimonadetes bacterium]|jgi:segregation and condensation protein B|nr:SMC-Scp complex subunit ScpB [Armatimonadota bacterium]
MAQTDLVNALECLLFVSEDPLSAQDAAGVLGAQPREVEDLIAALQKRLEGSGLHVVCLAGGYALGTRPEYADYVETLLQPDPQRLSRQALEVLAIVAYRQPITRPEVDSIRGVNSSGVVNSLLEKDLLKIAGRAKAPGRPFLLSTTATFLSAFGLRSLDDMPQLELPLPKPESAAQLTHDTADLSAPEAEAQTDAAPGGFFAPGVEQTEDVTSGDEPPFTEDTAQH